MPPGPARTPQFSLGPTKAELQRYYATPQAFADLARGAGLVCGHLGLQQPVSAADLRASLLQAGPSLIPALGPACDAVSGALGHTSCERQARARQLLAYLNWLATPPEAPIAQPPA